MLHCKLHLFSHSWAIHSAPYKHSFWSAIFIFIFFQLPMSSNKSFQLKLKTPLDLFYYSFKFSAFNLTSAPFLSLTLSLSSIIAWGINWLPVFVLFNFFSFLPPFSCCQNWHCNNYTFCAQTSCRQRKFVFFLSTRKLYYQKWKCWIHWIGCSLHEPHILCYTSGL